MAVSTDFHMTVLTDVTTDIRALRVEADPAIVDLRGEIGAARYIESVTSRYIGMLQLFGLNVEDLTKVSLSTKPPKNSQPLFKKNERVWNELRQSTIDRGGRHVGRPSKEDSVELWICMDWELYDWCGCIQLDGPVCEPE